MKLNQLKLALAGKIIPSDQIPMYVLIRFNIETKSIKEAIKVAKLKIDHLTEP